MEYKVGDIVVTTNDRSHTDNCIEKPAGYIFRIGELSRQSDKIFYREKPAIPKGVTDACIRYATAFEISALELGVKQTSQYGGRPEIVTKYQIY